MSISIKNDETKCLARLLAAETGESMTRAVTKALAERLQRIERRRTATEKLALARTILRRREARRGARRSASCRRDARARPAPGRRDTRLRRAWRALSAMTRRRRPRGPAAPAAAAGVVVDTSALLAGDAWRRFGKGRHPAGLNIIDCCAYAVAQQTDRRLLAVGRDLAKTDAELVELTPAPAT